MVTRYGQADVPREVSGRGGRRSALRPLTSLGTSAWPYRVKPRLHSRGFRAGCTRLDDPCTAGSTTLPRPGTSVPGRERPWATAWRFSTGSEFLSWGKNQSRFFLSGAQTCLFVSWRPWLWHERDKASHNRDRAGEKSVCFWGRLS